MPAGKRRTADVGNAFVQREVRARRFADKLLAPIGIANFAAVTFAIIEDFDLFDAAFVGVEFAKEPSQAFIFMALR